jgi:hypothetical protein
MALTLSEIRAKLQQQEDKKGGNKSGGSFGDGTVYPHWNIEEGDVARLRFLPDADPKNNFFWVERQQIKLEFNGIKGQPDSKKVMVQVPCIEMFPGYENKCPILAEVRPWFKDKSLEDMGRKYWKKKSYLMQGFVHENPLKEDKTPENPIRRFVISPQIFNLVKAALMDPELENLPTDYENGLDFTINKTSKGGYANYDTSKWSRKESALTADELAAIEKYGLFNLTEYLPKMPTAEELVIMKEMFEASVDGQAYDGDKWGKFFKPAGFQGGNSDEANESAPVAKAAPAPVAAKPTPTPVKAAPVSEDFDADDDVPAASEPVKAPAASGSRAEDILAMIRNRQKTST